MQHLQIDQIIPNFRPDGLIMIFILFVILTFSNYNNIFIKYIHLIIILVFLHSLFAIITGFGLAMLWSGKTVSQYA